MSPKSRAISGPLVRRVDPDALPQLRAELDAPARGRRKRALELAVAMELTAELQEPIAALLKDEDQYLRIDAIRVLARADSLATRQLLRDALLDAQPLVQQAAEAELARLMHDDTVVAAGDGSHDTVSAAPPAVEGEMAASPPNPKALTETWTAAQLAEVRR